MNPSRRSVLLFAIATVPATLTAQSPATDAHLLATACNHLAADLHGQLAARGTPTSGPGSIAFALLMLLPGARGETEQELIKVLHLPEPLRGARLHAAAKALLATVVLPEGRRGDAPQLRLVDDLWTQEGYPILPAYSDLLRSSYGASHHRVQFTTAPEAARTEINSHIAAVTNQRIPELLTPDLVTPATTVVITNAMWLKAAWQHPFTAGATAPRPFTLQDGTAVEVPTMTVTDTFAWTESDAWQCVVLPFAGCDVVAELALPREGHQLAAAERALLTGATRRAPRNEVVQVQLPKFRLAAAHRLREPLAALGMRTAFQAGLADFTGMSPRRELFVDDVVHQTWIQFDEAGAEAAAATAVVMKRGGAGSATARFVADRAFAFVLRHAPSGLVLFAGRVDDPRQAPTATHPAR